jgi:hypothetical protein
LICLESILYAAFWGAVQTMDIGGPIADHLTVKTACGCFSQELVWNRLGRNWHHKRYTQDRNESDFDPMKGILEVDKNEEKKKLGHAWK